MKKLFMCLLLSPAVAFCGIYGIATDLYYQIKEDTIKLNEIPNDNVQWWIQIGKIEGMLFAMELIEKDLNNER